MNEARKTEKALRKQVSLDELFLGIESGALVSESPSETMAIKRAGDLGTKERTEPKSTQSIKTEPRPKARTFRPKSFMVNAWKKGDKVLRQALVPLVMVGLILAGAYALTSGSSNAPEVKKKSEVKTPVTPSPDQQSTVSSVPAPQPKATGKPAPAPRPKTTGSPAPAPKGNPAPAPEGNASPAPKGNPTPPGGTKIPTGNLKLPAPIGTPAPETKVGIPAPTNDFDQTDSTPRESSQRTELTDQDHGGEANRGDQTMIDDGTGELIPASPDQEIP